MKKALLFTLLAAITPILWAGPGLSPNREVGPAQPATETGGASSFRFLGGDAAEGKAAFGAMSCTQCHQVKGVELPRPQGKIRLELVLGAESRFVKSYEDLITAITNPKHVITERYRVLLTQEGDIEPFMPNFTDKMTVKQLMDIVAFLDECYTDNRPDYKKPR